MKIRQVKKIMNEGYRVKQCIVERTAISVYAHDTDAGKKRKAYLSRFGVTDIESETTRQKTG